MIDASVTLSWLFEDESDPTAQQALDAVEKGTRIYVPGHWALEISNALRMAEKRGRINDGDVIRIKSMLAALEPSVDDETSDHAFDDTFSLARRYELTIYDAAYLELAIRQQIPLVTLDRDLRKAAKSLGQLE